MSLVQAGDDQDPSQGGVEGRSSIGMEKAKVLGRREFLRVLGPMGAMLGAGWLLAKQGESGQFVRPPGALHESDFLARCIKCRRCEEVCPQQVIQPVTLSQSWMAAGTPHLDFRQGYCDLCMRCVEECPSGALRFITPEHVRLGIAEVDRAACVAWAWDGCSVCTETCPTNAIVLDEHNRPTVDPDLCNGCGMCEWDCPRATLRNYDPARSKGIRVVPLQHTETSSVRCMNEREGKV